MAQLHVEVVAVRARAELDLLDVDRMLTLAGFLGLLLLLVLVLAPVHDPADGRTRSGRDFDEVEALFKGALARCFDGQDSELFAVGGNDSDRGDADLVVDSGRTGDGNLS